ncbi:hypothetical protein PLUA15_320040 [Pseudomonas lundensis]|uniref:Uncharacterized protein n=1 Tax=Pseudomonas lundensis TaxID=86185 RepID=A0AAX2HAW3_9PSED|nr:hypothetical protein PLUA15_320040 [Pseudomonas lundensis]
MSGQQERAAAILCSRLKVNTRRDQLLHPAQLTVPHGIQQLILICHHHPHHQQSHSPQTGFTCLHTHAHALLSIAGKTSMVSALGILKLNISMPSSGDVNGGSDVRSDSVTQLCGGRGLRQFHPGRPTSAPDPVHGQPANPSP